MTRSGTRSELPRRFSIALLTIAAGLVPAVATASNMTHPRTPVAWEDVPCLTLHDRSESATFHLPYDIPFEDLDVTPDEVADSRTHQFFAYCRPHHPQNFLPTWITQADVDDAVSVDLLMPGTVEDQDILDNSTQWADCWFRINGDDERRPISDDMAAAGVDWDTTGLAGGAYTLYGYTYEPVFNIWTLRPGVLKLHDGDPHAVGPAAAITTGELTPYRDDEVMIEGCVHALEGSTFTAYWALTADDPEWVEYLGGQEISGEDFAFAFTPPEAMWGESGLIRVDFIDPEGREYTTYQADNMLVINSDNPDACDQGGSFIGSPCGDSSGSGDSGGSGSESASDTASETGTSPATGDTSGDAGSASDDTGPGITGGDEGPKEACACTTEGSRSPAPWMLALVLPLVRRRRR